MLSLTANPGIFVAPEILNSRVPLLLIAAAVFALILNAVIPGSFGPVKKRIFAAAVIVAGGALVFSIASSVDGAWQAQAASVEYRATVAEWLNSEYGVTVKASSIPLNPEDKLVQITGKLDAKPVIVGFSSNEAGDLLAFDGNAKPFTKVN